MDAINGDENQGEMIRPPRSSVQPPQLDQQVVVAIRQSVQEIRMRKERGVVVVGCLCCCCDLYESNKVGL